MAHARASAREPRFLVSDVVVVGRVKRRDRAHDVVLRNGHLSDDADIVATSVIIRNPENARSALEPLRERASPAYQVQSEAPFFGGSSSERFVIIHHV